ncbi:hypothetical protein G9A89_023856 [Geosiphon pyriformis]|nr:hypothetical protein G9A89_023856 [Geosiphon pyriformis]
MQQQYQQPLSIQPYQTPPIQQYQVPARRLVQHNQFTPQNQFQNNNNRINPNNHGSAGSIITYQLMQQLQRTVDRPAQTVIVITDSMKKTPVEEIDNFLFIIDGITIPIKVLVMDAPQYQVLVENDWLLKANANLDWETQELKNLIPRTIHHSTCYLWYF